MANNDIIQITASDPLANPADIFLTGQTDVTTGFTDAANPNTLGTSPTATTSSGKIIHATIKQAIILGTTLSLRFGPELLLCNPLPEPTDYYTPRVITFGISMGPSGTLFSAVDSTIGPSAYTVALADPITFVNGTKVKFWLPYDTLSPLLVTPDLALLARPFQGPTEDLQWFDQFVVRLPDGREVIDISVQRRASATNRSSRGRRGLFNQLEIRLYGNNQPAWFKPGQYESYGVRFALGVGDFGRPRTHSVEKAEYVLVETATVAFAVFASHAGTEFPSNIEMQAKHTHLDWVCLDMNEDAKSSFSGILPELWGWSTPLSDKVAAMLRPPSKANESLVEDYVCNGQVCTQPEESGSLEPVGSLAVSMG
jgi:hypothetical protein